MRFVRKKEEAPDLETKGATGVQGATCADGVQLDKPTKPAKKVKYHSVAEIAEKFGVTKQAVVHQIVWRKIGIKARGKYLLSDSELKELSFRRPNGYPKPRAKKSKK